MSTARSRSRASHSRPRISRHTPSVPYISQVENLILPDGTVGEETAELLNDLAHPGPHSPLFGDSDFSTDSEPPLSEQTAAIENGGSSNAKKLPWWKTPSPWWYVITCKASGAKPSSFIFSRLLATTPFTAIAMSATLAPRIEIYTSLACRVHKPEIFKHSFPTVDHGISATDKVIVSNHSFSSPVLLSPILDTIIAPSGEFAYQNQSQPANPNLCASDPVVQAAVAKLTTGKLSDHMSTYFRPAGMSYAHAASFHTAI